jgi:hypothetical protein
MASHRQEQQAMVRGGRHRVRASGRALHSVTPVDEGRFELVELEREVEGDAEELALVPARQLRRDPAAVTTADAIARRLDSGHRFRFEGRESVAGREAWLLTFDALPEERAIKNVKENVRRALRGRLWIDVEEGAVLRSEAELVRPVDLLGGKVRRMRIVRDQRPAFDGRWVPTATELESEVRVFTIDRKRTERTSFGGWALVEPEPALESDRADDVPPTATAR